MEVEQKRRVIVVIGIEVCRGDAKGVSKALHCSEVGFMDPTLVAVYSSSRRKLIEPCEHAKALLR